jgi:hypothetical protein
MTFATLFPALEPWLRALAENEHALAIKPFFPHFQVAHLVSLFLLGGCAILLNLRLVGSGFEEPSAWVERRLRPLLDLSAAGALATGVLIAALEPMKLYGDTPFLVKMTALLAALVATYGAALPLARANGVLGRTALAAFVVALLLWALALWIFATTLGSSPGVLLVIFAGGLLLALALRGRTRWVYLLGLTAILVAQQVVTHGFIGPDDIAVLDPVNTAFSAAEAAWVLAFLLVLGCVARGTGTSPAARFVGCATLLIWITVAAAGRWIAFG